MGLVSKVSIFTIGFGVGGLVCNTFTFFTFLHFTFACSPCVSVCLLQGYTHGASHWLINKVKSAETFGL